MARERIYDATEEQVRALFGPLDRHLRALRERFGVRVTYRHDVLALEGDDPLALADVVRRVKQVLARAARAEGLDEAAVEVLLLGGVPAPGETSSAAGSSAVTGARGEGEPSGARSPRPTPGPHGSPKVSPPGGLYRGHAPRPPGAGEAIRPRTPNQERYVRAIRQHDVVFAVGPAGTGKTFLAVVEAVAALRAGHVRRIVLTRPAVEAGEKLGFLPGDLHAKINPYLRPLYDALGELLPYGEMQRYVASDVIEIVPLAYMRGRTLKDAFIILDEAQNTTPAQMKMFLTRLGLGSKAVVTGDVTQVDLPEGVTSGLTHAAQLLGQVSGITVLRFLPQDILRHPLVQRIVDAYDSQAERRPVDGESAALDPRGP